MPLMNGIDAAREILKSHPATRILVCSVHATESTVIEAIEAGVKGYILKDAAPEDLDRAARAVMSGRAYFSPAIASVMVSSLNQRNRRRVQLSPRERQVVQLVSEGLSLDAISKQLFVSVQTVKTHRANAMRKLEAKTTAGLVRYAFQHGLTSL
jgi:DNA-binding NarL/FixJ family response regulator